MSWQWSLLRIYTDESAYFGDQKVFEVIVERAWSDGLAGATVLEALLGFRRQAHRHSRHLIEDERSVVIEIVDDEAALRTFAEALTDLPHIGLITLEPVTVLRSALPTEERAP